MRRPLLLAILVALAVPTPALAGEAQVVMVGAGYKDSVASMAYGADPGERNRIVVAHDPGTSPETIVLRDSGARLVVPGDGCTRIDAQTIRCAASTAMVDAGDGDDTLTTPTTGSRVVARGGAGADTLTGGGYLSGGPGDDVLEAGQLSCMGPCLPVVLDGGSGNDVLHGGSADDVLSGDNDGAANPFVGDASETGPLDDARGDDTIDGGPGTDTVHYTRRAGVRVDLADHARNGEPGERDRLTNVEDVTGGDGPDVLIGDGGPNELIGGSGSDTLVGRGGDDVLRDERISASQDFLQPNAPDGADTLRGGAGNDALDGGGERGDRLFGGPGNDLLTNELEVGATRARTLSCGTGTDRLASKPSGQLLSDCERATLGIVTMSVRPQRRPGGGLRFAAMCAGTFAGKACALKVTLRLRSARIAQRSMTIARGASRTFLMRPARPVRRGATLDVTVSGAAGGIDVYDFTGRWRVRP